MNSVGAKHIVVYWGRRGGGLDLFDLFVEECNERNIPIIASARPTVSRQDEQSSGISFINVRAWFTQRKSLLRQAAEGGIRSVVFIMSSPWDLFLGMRLEKSGVQVVRIIHDANPHPGEKFPPNFWIKLLTKDCSRIVTLSNYVARQLTTRHGVDQTKIMVCSFPTPKIENNQLKKKSSPKKILLIGRGKKYQGQKLLEEAWDLIDKTDKALVIAGEGFKPNPKHSDIEYKNWWMTREEMIDEISSSDLVVFPYTEASQSGTIPICRALGKPVVVTPVGGLMEQVEEGVNGLICEEVGKVELAQSISAALQKHWGAENFNKVLHAADLVDGCLSRGSQSSFDPDKAAERS
jgi:glycosyltransferase involved in cell wall biosynthesis